ncbi:hypothetical protein Q2T41_19180 [Maribacter confluentis]|uniref:Uncharacterized protein n=1 Tax=Maribacter confluentis TaxID=1656093 RepID=A0ABT8RV47_9FLAO|nr:hypothetical protein [Maribacter confluentis]MDO1514778.1 hypothetical protein [Maribacter confluentis]
MCITLYDLQYLKRFNEIKNLHFICLSELYYLKTFNKVRQHDEIYTATSYSETK